MSAFIQDPRHIDYLVAWANSRCAALRHSEPMTGSIWDHEYEIPEDLRDAATGADEYGWRLRLQQVSPDDLGRILMRENIRSVRARYKDSAPDDLPGPIDQTRVWNYKYRRVGVDYLRPSWVVMACDGYRYQACETGEYEDTLAGQIVDAIRESAIAAWLRDADEDSPAWSLTDEDLSRKRERAS